MGIVASVLNLIFNVAAALTQAQTNGASLLGALTAPLLPLFLTNNPIINGFPWGGSTTGNTNPYTNYPNTGVIRSYDWTVTRATIAPDGYQKSVLLVNGAFPGPTIEANWGDTIQVTIHNQITGPTEPTSFHWHGQLQKNNQWEDGVPGVDQCPIVPGGSYTYSFPAELYGSSWWHSHYSAQYSGGLFGAMVIHGPYDNCQYDIDVGPVLLTDHYHEDYFTILARTLSNGTDAVPNPPSDNNLINGKMNFDCSKVAAGDKTTCTNNAGVSKFKFTTGKKHRLRLINAGSDALQRFSLDGHTLTVMSYDFVPIKPYDTKVVTLGVGQRADVIVQANAGASNTAYWMRSNISTICTATKQPFAVAAVYYDKADTNKSPTSQAWNVPDPGNCANDALSTTEPSYSITPAAVPATTRTMEINFGFNATHHFLWSMDGVNMRTNFNTPVMLLANTGQTTFDPMLNVKNFGSNSTIRMIINNKTPASHPMHLHGHNMYILAEGNGAWDGTIVRAANPMRRDTQMIRPGGYMVVQIDADNPGVWPFHCHIAWHVSGGLNAYIMERPADIKKINIPNKVAQTCRDWSAYTGMAIPNQIDSGL